MERCGTRFMRGLVPTAFGPGPGGKGVRATFKCAPARPPPLLPDPTRLPPRQRAPPPCHIGVVSAGHCAAPVRPCALEAPANGSVSGVCA
jgi:hypothetical protein